MLYYLNLFIVYSILGFILESCVYKTKNINCYSGVLYGPFTIIYGFGCVVLNLLNDYVYVYINSIILKIIVIFSISLLVLSFIEYMGAIILRYLFKTEMWNYSNRKYNYRGYVCLNNSIVWGILGVIYATMLKCLLDSEICRINPIITNIFMVIIILNIIITIIVKNKKLILYK